MGSEGKRVKLTGPWKVKARVEPLSGYLSLDPPRLLKALSSRDLTTRFNAWRGAGAVKGVEGGGGGAGQGRGPL